VTAAARAADADLTIASLLLLVSVVVAGLFGATAAIATGIAAFLAQNWFFTEPTGSFAIKNRDDVVALTVFAVAAAVVGWIVRRLDLLRRAAQHSEQAAELRLQLASRVGRGVALDDALETGAAALAELFAFERCSLQLAEHEGSAGDSPRSNNLRIDAPGVTLEAVTRHQLEPSDRALLDALVVTLSTEVDRMRLADEVRDARLAAEIGRQRAGFLSAVSHNLRTPLTAVKAAASTLLSSWSRLDAEDRRELIETIYDESERLERLVRNTLELSRIRAGALEPHPEPVDVADLVRHAVRRLRPLSRAHRVRLDVADELGTVALDVTMTDQILLNLLENTLKYAPPGSEIVVRAAPVDSSCFELAVVDHGPGVPPELRDRIFDEFASGDERPDKTGTGLGLAIVRAMTRAQGGDVRYEATPTGGATFVCTFPRKPS
jgi:two-component system sensor histidine kinase KdpD